MNGRSKNNLAFRHASFHGQVGLAQADITPPVGIYARNWGAATHDVASSIHHPLLLNALTLSPGGGGSPLVLLDADLGWWQSPQIYDRFSKRLRDAAQVAEAGLIIALSHTHAGPPLMEVDSSLPGGDLLGEWMEQLIDSAIEVVRSALANTFLATLDWHLGRCNLAAIRDLPDPASNESRMICGFNPDGHPDDTLVVGRITDSAGQLRATLTNYACHPTTLAWENTAISPDYVGAMRQTIQQYTGAPAMFLLGACGDLAPRYQYLGDTSVADRHGRQLAFSTLAVLADMEPAGAQLFYSGTIESGAPLAIWRHEPRTLSHQLEATVAAVELPIKQWPSADELERQRQECSDRALSERLRRKRDIRRGLGDRDSYALPIYVWKIGEAVLVGSCCEAYSILQQELRRRFPEHVIVCTNLINGSLGYLPPENLYRSDVYAVWQTPFDYGSLELLLDAMTGAIRDALTV